MGATSVTGLSGRGSAEGKGVKGPHNNRDIYLPVVGPHVIHSGRVTLAGGVATVHFPAPLVGSQSMYNVVLTCINGSVNTNETVVSVMHNNTDGNFDYFSIAGTGTQVVMWMVVKNGFGI